MVAFVTLPAAPRFRHALPSREICALRTPLRASRRSRISTTIMSNDSPGSSSPDAISEPSSESPVPPGATEGSASIPKEPYPGFFADMKRMGLSEEQAYAQAAKAQKQKEPVKSSKVGGKKNLLKPDGTPYAPWMGPMADYDATVIKKRTDATGKLAADPQMAELSGVGLTWKMLGDELELKWATGGEEGNMGFVVYRRAGKDTKWDKVSDYRDKPAELASKGPEGGQYSFLVPDAKPGSWVYRVSDVDGNNMVTDLSQVLVEIESAEDSRTQKIALAVLLVVLAVSVWLGLSLDPLSST
eukprot:GFKZ01015030.1.p1 GENE.GFKZ01015030.1~~GFKZ01015030.1.p1  ORF type:complete len:300 (+),score=42.70 GFKZ01015030.1:169-1068(+)